MYSSNIQIMFVYRYRTQQHTTSEPPQTSGVMDGLG